MIFCVEHFWGVFAAGIEALLVHNFHSFHSVMMVAQARFATDLDLIKVVAIILFFCNGDPGWKLDLGTEEG